MKVFYLNRRFIYLALILLISIYIILFYVLSLKIALTKYTEIDRHNENSIYNKVTLYSTNYSVFDFYHCNVL